MNELYCIVLREHSVPVRMGIHDFERAAPQRLLVSIAIALKRKARGDRIDAVVDYDYVRQAVITLAGVGHYELQETFCEALLARCRQNPDVLGIAVQTQKPDVYPDSRAVGCFMVWAEEQEKTAVQRLFAMLRL